MNQSYDAEKRLKIIFILLIIGVTLFTPQAFADDITHSDASHLRIIYGGGIRGVIEPCG